MLAEHFGCTAFTISAATAATAWMMVAFVVPWRPAPPPFQSQKGGLFDFRPVVRNTSAFAYSIVYCVRWK